MNTLILVASLCFGVPGEGMCITMAGASFKTADDCKAAIPAAIEKVSKGFADKPYVVSFSCREIGDKA